LIHEKRTMQTIEFVLRRGKDVGGNLVQIHGKSLCKCHSVSPVQLY
jgi:hypothetical protein